MAVPARSSSARAPIVRPVPGVVTVGKLSPAAMRAQLAELREQLGNLETETAPLDDLVKQLRRTADELRAHGMQVANVSLADAPGIVYAIRDGYHALIAKHLATVSIFEAELAKNLRPFRDREAALQRELQAECAKLERVRDEVEHMKKLRMMGIRDEAMLVRTLSLGRESLDRCTSFDAHECARAEQRVALQKQRYAERADAVRESHAKLAEAAQAAQAVKKATERILSDYEAKLARRAELEEQLRKVSFRHSCVLADLDKGKEELEQVMLQIRSQRDNLKTQELLQEELENRKLRGVLNNEVRSTEQEVAKLVSEERHLRKAIRVRNAKIAEWDARILASEQRLQQIAMRVPDFALLAKILQQARDMGAQFKAELNARQAAFEAVEARSREYWLQDARESKQRVDRLRALIPLEHEVPRDDPGMRTFLTQSHKILEDLDRILLTPTFIDNSA